MVFWCKIFILFLDKFKIVEFCLVRKGLFFKFKIFWLKFFRIWLKVILFVWFEILVDGLIRGFVFWIKLRVMGWLGIWNLIVVRLELI